MKEKAFRALRGGLAPGAGPEFRPMRHGGNGRFSGAFRQRERPRSRAADVTRRMLSHFFAGMAKAPERARFSSRRGPARGQARFFFAARSHARRAARRVRRCGRSLFPRPDSAGRRFAPRRKFGRKKRPSKGRGAASTGGQAWAGGNPPAFSYLSVNGF